MIKPVISRNLDVQTFKSYYYMKEELVNFCRQEGLQSTGGKLDLTDRIAHYLETGEKLKNKVILKNKLMIVNKLTEDSLIEDNLVCSEKHRDFFIEKIGMSFSFNVTFQKWLKANAGKTYKEAIEAYYIILSDKKKSVSVIDKQFEYNTYIRDFFADNEGKTLFEAIKCWKYKKSLRGHNRYEKSDLVILGLKID